MGKHERGKIALAEENLSKMLEDKEVSSDFKEHELYNSVEALYSKIHSDFPNIKESNHIGGGHDLPGDVKIELNSGEEIILELKFVEKSRRGTRANIGQDSLTDFSLIEPKGSEEPLPWSDFRKEQNHIQWVREKLDEYQGYPEKIKVADKNKNRIYKKASYLKEVIGVGNKEAKKVAKEILKSSEISEKEKRAAKIILEIVKKDRQEKLDYIGHLQNFPQNEENIKKFLFLILAGYHTHSQLEEKWNLNFKKIIKSLKAGYEVYYVNKETLEVKREDNVDKLKKLLLEGGEIYLDFKPEQTNLLISFKRGGESTPVFRVVLHWKNKFQGIQTPCLNIFDEEYLYSD